MRSLKTQTREGGIFKKIVFALFAPSKKAKRNNRASFFRACFTPLATKPSAQLYGGLVTMLSAERLVLRKSTPTSPYPRSYKSELRTGCPICSSTRDIAPSPHAHSQISPLNFSLSINAKVAQAGVGKKSGPLRSANLFIVGLNPPFRT